MWVAVPVIPRERWRRVAHRCLALITANRCWTGQRNTPGVQYLYGSGNALPVGDNAIDVVTFAGVLSYLDRGKAIEELRRVCRKDALVLPYDFEVDLSGLEDQLSLPTLSKAEDKSSYDHRCNFSGLSDISTLRRDSRLVELNVTEVQAAHILLSDKSRYEPLAIRFASNDPFFDVVETIRRIGWSGRLEATIHYTLHRLET